MAQRIAQTAEWARLMARLEEEMPQVVDDFMAQFAERGLYAPAAVSEEDLRETAGDTLRMLVARLAGRKPTEAEAVLAASLGVRRARQGVPLDALLEAVRLDFRVLWRWMQRIGGEQRVLIEGVEWVLSAVEEYVDEVQQSFLRETAALQRDARLATERHLSRLFSGDAPGETALQAIAAGLGVAVDDRFDLVAVRTSSLDEVQRALDAQLATGELFGHMHRDAYCVFWPTSSTGAAEALRAVPGVRVADLAGLAAVASGAEAALAMLAVEHLPPRLVGLDEAWPAVAAARLEELLPGFAATRLDALVELTDYQRTAVLRTVRTFLDTGSVQRTAAVAFCHRNTVLNRLAAFHERTGLDVTVPVEAALAHVLLSSRSVPEPAPTPTP
jgi:transcriptional regulator with XRE-family HTH domain